MTTFKPRAPYSDAELAKLYPKELDLQLVQILLRHGERSPVSPRFQNAGLRAFWPYCNSAQQLMSVIMGTRKSQWDSLQFRRRLETFGADDSPEVASGPAGEYDAICQPGELTDKGRETTLALGQRLRNLYVDQLGFMPSLISDSDMIYLRATPIPRALESVQQAFWGLYPPSSRTADFPAPTILLRAPADETLYPNDGNCRRFAQLSRAFAQRTADRWNDTDDMKYLNKLIGKWMPADSPHVAVDSRPRLSGIMDTINSTDAHGIETKLPKEFYDEKLRAVIDKIGVEEWFTGYKESQEYRMLGIGGLAADIVGRMAGHIAHSGEDGSLEVGGSDGHLGRGRGGEKDIKFALSGCHDTTLASLLTSLGAHEGGQMKWPPYTSHVAVELFKQSRQASSTISIGMSAAPGIETNKKPLEPGWWSALFGPAKDKGATPSHGSRIRRPLSELTAQEKGKLDGYYVRVRYNDEVMKIPGCRVEGKHWDGDESFCTLAAFKEIVDKYTPRSWKHACMSNLDKGAFPPEPEPSGY